MPPPRRALREEGLSIRDGSAADRGNLVDPGRRRETSPSRGARDSCRPRPPSASGRSGPGPGARSRFGSVGDRDRRGPRRCARQLAARRAVAPPASAGGTRGLAGRAGARARAIVDEYGEDSLSPLILRPDKSFAFSAGGVAAYRVIGERRWCQAIRWARRRRPGGPRAAARPRAPRGPARRGLTGGRSAISRPTGRSAYAPGASGGRWWSTPRTSRWRVDRSASCVSRCTAWSGAGWQIEVCDGRDIDRALEAEIDALEAAVALGTRAPARIRDEHGRVRVGGAAEGPVRAGTVARRPAAGGDAIPRPSRQAVAGHDAPGGRDAQRTQRGAGLPRAGVRALSRHPRSEPQLRRARPPGQARAVRQPCRQGAHPVHAQPAAEELSDGPPGPLQSEVLPQLASSLPDL